MPAVVLANLDHGGEDVVPGLLLHQRVVREHATVPADVLQLFGDLAFAVAEPVAGVADDIEFTLRIGGKAVAAGLLVRAGTKDTAVVLRDVEVDRPRAERVG